MDEPVNTLAAVALTAACVAVTVLALVLAWAAFIGMRQARAITREIAASRAEMDREWAEARECIRRGARPAGPRFRPHPESDAGDPPP